MYRLNVQFRMCYFLQFVIRKLCYALRAEIFEGGPSKSPCIGGLSTRPGLPVIPLCRGTERVLFFIKISSMISSVSYNDGSFGLPPKQGE